MKFNLNRNLKSIFFIYKKIFDDKIKILYSSILFFSKKNNINKSSKKRSLKIFYGGEKKQ